MCSCAIIHDELANIILWMGDYIQLMYTRQKLKNPGYRLLQLQPQILLSSCYILLLHRHAITNEYHIMGSTPEINIVRHKLPKQMNNNDLGYIIRCRGSTGVKREE